MIGPELAASANQIFEFVFAQGQSNQRRRLIGARGALAVAIGAAIAVYERPRSNVGRLLLLFFVLLLIRFASLLEICDRVGWSKRAAGIVGTALVSLAAGASSLDPFCSSPGPHPATRVRSKRRTAAIGTMLIANRVMFIFPCTISPALLVVL